MAETQNLIEAKLAELGLEQSPEEFVNGLPPHIKRRVEALQELQKRRDEIEAQFKKEKAELEARYEKLYSPLYSERAEVVSGSKDIPVKEGEPVGNESVKGIPEFWSTVLMKCDTTAELIKDKDLEVLNYLIDIKAENIFQESGEPGGFKLIFTFSSNPFFSNTVLEKTYFMMAEDDGVLEKSEGTKIEWKTGKDVTVKIMKKKPKRGGKDAKPQIKTEKVESFFNFFSPPEVPDEDEDIDEETMEELQALIETDYEIGATIKEKLIAKAVSWYTGEAIEDEPYYFGGDDEDEEFDGEDGEEDDDDDGDEDHEPAPVKGGKGKGGKGKGGEQPPECKQQ
ncbi:hypothetical protein CEUSTIGMA_g12652.t1 [Chlamydomonas eustigma]|uniref:Nucleosome assembly protein n=1 Tax=Chlamydomonas eustigma TaxID=1157962 RepID=A0A250XQL9_9CHLO|nr:hypothetical protein CEUSTIGMA_g12652.t1 [Chlamydomonas eustigma]|eukprot:GAX85232.1 hypothetical protein CEUSTIGMA_g12652.t1 [Chlamydomonas eustigma]